jgi:hypothetical protein
LLDDFLDLTHRAARTSRYIASHRTTASQPASQPASMLATSLSPSSSYYLNVLG